MRGKKIIVFFVLIAVLLMPVAVFADVPMPDPPYGSLPYWVVADVYGEICLYTSNNPITVDPEGYNKLVFCNYKKYKFINNEWSYDKETLGQAQTGFEKIYASNHNIEYIDGSGFFFTPPKASTLYQIVRQAKTQGVFGMIWKIILAGLIPLVGLLILGISFRKGWAFLRRQLMH